MRFSLPLAILGIVAVIAVGLLIDSPWSSGGDDHSKSGIASQLGQMMEEQHAPPELTKCFVASVERQLTDREVELAYERMPPEADLGKMPVTQLPPPLGEKATRAALLCTQRLLRSGASRREIAEMMQRMAR